MALDIIQYDGQPISRPGLYAAIPMDRYHSGDLCVGPSISSSGLRTIIGKSPRHYWAESPHNPNGVPRKETDAMRLGRAAHHLLLGEAEFEKHYAVRPDDWTDWRTNAAKAWREAKQAEGFTVIEPADLEKIAAMAESLAGEPLIELGALQGLVEHSLLWEDPDTGVWIKVRPDAIPTDDLDFADLKVTADVSTDAIEKSIGKFGYGQQGALVGSASKAVLGREMSSFSLICVESTAPHCVQVRALEPVDLELGERSNAIAIKTFVRGLETGFWPGPGGTQQDAERVSMKPFDRLRIENRLALLEQELKAA
jgi:hypothetical protein